MGPRVREGLILPPRPPLGLVPLLAGLLSVLPQGAARGVALDFLEAESDGVAGVDGLGDASSVAVSPDGAHVYATGEGDDALAVFARTGPQGQLTFVEVQRDGVGGVDGLDGASWVALSPDGAHVYAAASVDAAVAVFARNAGTGALTFVEVQRDGVGGVDGLWGASGVAVSPDGAHVYAAGPTDSSVAVFSRDTGTGALTFVELQDHGVGGVQGLAGARAVALSSDGAHLYVAARSSDAVAVFSRNAATGALGFLEFHADGVAGVDGLNGVQSVALSPDDAHVYLVSEFDQAIAVFSRNPVTGRLAFVEFHTRVEIPGLQAPAVVTVSPDGSQVFVATRIDDGVVVFARDAAHGTLERIEYQRNGVAGVDGLDGARAVAASGDGANVYAASLDDDALVAFERPPPAEDVAALALVEVERGGNILDRPTSAVASPGGEHVYVTSDRADALSLFSRDAGSGALSLVEVYRQGDGAISGLSGANAVAMSPDGAHVYAAGSGSVSATCCQVNGISLFERDAATGRLEYAGTTSAGREDVTLSPDGAHLYAADLFGDQVEVYARHPVTGALAFAEAETDGVGGVDGLDETRAVRVSPDGAHVYAASSADDAIAVFARDAGTGALGFVEVQKDGVGGVDGLNGANRLALSPDGAHLYAVGNESELALFSRNPVTGALGFLSVVSTWVGQGCGIDVTSDGMQVLVACSSQLAVFSRDPGTGALAFQEVHRDNLGGVDGLGGAWRVIESPDGAHVYTLASLDDAAAVFSRDPGTGALAFVESYADGVGGVQGQDVPAVVAVSPDGAHLYVGAQEWGSTGGSLTVLAVEPTGDLTFVEEVAEGFGPPDGSVSSRAQGVAVSPDGAHVYATDGTDGAVAAFSRDGGTGALAFVERQEDGVGGVDGLAGAWDVALSPDGAHVYVTGPAEAALAVFERNPGTGALGFVEFEQNDFVLGTVDGLWGGASVAVSPDGANVYVAGQEDEALAVFSRDALTGELDFVEVQRDVGMAGGLPSALSSAVSVAVSPDGAHVYAAGYDADAVAVFSRDALTGELDFVEAQRDGMAGAELINAPTDVAVSPDGALVLVTGYENAVTVFRRDAATGSLTWLEEHADGVLSDGLEGANAVRLGADGAFAYVVGLFEQGSAAYRLRAIEPVAAGMGASAFGGSGVAGGLDVAFGAGTGGSLRAQHRRVPLSAAASGLPGPASVDFALAGDPASVWELAFDGAFTGLATLTLGYDGAALLSGASEGDLQVHRFQLGTWTPLAKVGQDPGADTLTVATGDLALSTLALGGPSVLPGSLVFTGSAQGGTIELRVGAVLLVVVTAPGQTPEEVAEAAADAINADPILAAGGVAASSAGPVLETNGAVTSIEVGDPGLGVAPPVAPPVPALPWEGLWWALALVLGALGILAVRRASSPAGRR